jgi:RNA polymerase sigma factor (sigma-70 family)
VITLEEDAIVSRLKRHEETAIIEVVDAYKQKIIAFCNHYTNDYQDAEDLSQEIFISLYNSMGFFRGECSLKTFIYKIAVSKCQDYRRKKSIKNFLRGLFTYNRDSNNDFEEDNHIRQCILSLKETLKVPVLLYYYNGLTQAEIAVVLNISPKTVEGRMYRAKQKIKEQLEYGGERHAEEWG